MILPSFQFAKDTRAFIKTAMFNLESDTGEIEPTTLELLVPHSRPRRALNPFKHQSVMTFDCRSLKGSSKCQRWL